MSDLIKKLSAKIIMGEEKLNARLIPQGLTRIDLFSVVGVANGVKSGESNFGVWESLVGRFRAIRTSDGHTMDSAKLFLPDVALDMITSELASGATGVEFAFCIGIMLSDKAACGYEYFARPLVEAQGEDPLERLMKSAAIVKIEAPKDEAAVVDAKAKKVGK